MNGTGLFWRAEHAVRAAWPARREISCVGWCIRISGGTIRRVNSANPLPEQGALDAVALSEIERVFAENHQPALIRTLGFLDAHDELLISRGYIEEGETGTLFARNLVTMEAPVNTTLDIMPGPDWLSARAAFGQSGQALFGDMIARIDHPKAFVSTRAGGQVASIAYGVVVGDLLVVESVATAPAMRNRGLARQALLRLFAWAVESGAQSGVLQVLAANAPARALYRRLGFDRHLFDYRYWRHEL